MSLLTQSKSGLSAMELKRQIGVNYDTVWKMNLKLLQSMKENDMDCGEQRRGKRGRSSSNKTPFAAVVSLNKDGHPIHIRINVMKGFRSSEIEQQAKKHLKATNIVIFLSLWDEGSHYLIIRTLNRSTS
jgi:hypothetical protein